MQFVTFYIITVFKKATKAQTKTTKGENKMEKEYCGECSEGKIVGDCSICGGSGERNDGSPGLCRECRGTGEAEYECECQHK